MTPRRSASAFVVTGPPAALLERVDRLRVVLDGGGDGRLLPPFEIDHGIAKDYSHGGTELQTANWNCDLAQLVLHQLRQPLGHRACTRPRPAPPPSPAPAAPCPRGGRGRGRGPRGPRSRAPRPRAPAGAESSAPRSATRTLIRSCGSLVIASRSARSRPASASSASSAEAMPSPEGTKPVSMMWPDCSPPSAQPRRISSAITWRSPTWRGGHLDAGRRHRRVEAEVGHHGHRHAVARQPAGVAQVERAQRDQLVAVHHLAAAVDGQHAVAVAVEGEAERRSRPSARLGERLDVRRAAARR